MCVQYESEKQQTSEIEAEIKCWSVQCKVRNPAAVQLTNYYKLMGRETHGQTCLSRDALAEVQLSFKLMEITLMSYPSAFCLIMPNLSLGYSIINFCI